MTSVYLLFSCIRHESPQPSSVSPTFNFLFFVNFLQIANCYAWCQTKLFTIRGRESQAPSAGAGHQYLTPWTDTVNINVQSVIWGTQPPDDSNFFWYWISTFWNDPFLLTISVNHFTFRSHTSHHPPISPSLAAASGWTVSDWRESERQWQPLPAVAATTSHNVHIDLSIMSPVA